MKNLFIYISFVLFSASCMTKEKEKRLADFKNVEGILYYEKPETGSIVYAVFLPSNGKNVEIDFTKKNNFKNGIKFSTANSIIKDKLYVAKYQKAILKGGIDREVYLLPKAKIYFHIDTPNFSEKNVIERDLQSDTLIYMNKNLILKYRYSWLVIDSIKTY